MKLNPFIFRAYDVRGKVGIDITPDVFTEVGRAYGTLVRRKGGRVVALGMDNRTSSPPLKEGFAAGILSTGVDVVDIGVNHTPLLYFATAHWRLDGGATVTGSHNPVSDNGVKMVHAGAAPLSEEEIQGLLTTIRSGDFERGEGRQSRRNPREEYFEAITSRVRLARPLRVVVDAGNGIAGSFAPELLRRLGCDVVELYCESDGTFPNHLPDPEMEENTLDLVRQVVEVGADVGIAYDGDADRMGVIDERGRRHEADLILALLARDLLQRHPGAEIVFDVKSSQVLIDDLRAHGGRPVMWKTGHSHLKRKMRDDGILLGGEVSGHMFFGENWYGVDDGILASCRFLELVSKSAAARLLAFRQPAASLQYAGAQGALPRRQEVRRRAGAGGRAEAAVRDHRHRRRPHPLPGGLGPRARLEYEPLSHAAVRGANPGGRRRDEARGVHRARPLQLCDPAAGVMAGADGPTG